MRILLTGRSQANRSNWLRLGTSIKTLLSLCLNEGKARILLLRSNHESECDDLARFMSADKSVDNPIQTSYDHQTKIAPG